MTSCAGMMRCRPHRRRPPSRRTEVLHVIPSLGPLRGGPSFALPVMARGLTTRGIEVHIATTDDNGPSRLSVPLGHPRVEGNMSTWYFRRQLRPYTVSWPLTRWLAE